MAGRWRTWVASLVLVLGSLSVALLALEVGYRYQVIDMYRPELLAYNPAAVLTQDDKPTLLAMGDSFTAGRTSYAGVLQDTLREWRVINAGISGTGVLQARYLAPRRFAAFRPRLLLYQVYVGNDLFDLRYPVNWQTLAPGRNVYWFLANHFRVVGYSNYRLRQLTDTYLGRQGSLPALRSVAWAADAAERFAVEQYDVRVKITLRAEPALLEDTVLVQGQRQHDYRRWLEHLAALVAHCIPETCRAAVLVIPHVVQVDAAFVQPMQQLGARLTAPERLRQPDYPFMAGIRTRFATWPHVHLLNPLPLLRMQHAQRPVYYANDEHLNAVGQQVLATWVSQQLALQ